MMTERALDAQFGNAIEEIKEIEQAIEAAESSVEAARDEVRIEVGIHDPAVFNKLAAPIEQKHTAPWLRRRQGTDEIRVVDLERGVERVPTAEELAEGIVASTIDEYNAGKVAA